MEQAVLRLEESSTSVPERMNVLVQAGTWDACQAIVSQIMEESMNASFTIPVRGADGQFVSIGHYIKPAEPLPEY